MFVVEKHPDLEIWPWQDPSWLVEVDDGVERVVSISRKQGNGNVP